MNEESDVAASHHPQFDLSLIIFFPRGHYTRSNNSGTTGNNTPRKRKYNWYTLAYFLRRACAPTSTVVIMKVDEFVSGPALQQVKTPGPTCLKIKFSSAKGPP